MEADISPEMILISYQVICRNCLQNAEVAFNRYHTASKTLFSIDLIKAADRFNKVGWRVINNEVKCPECVK